MFFRRLNVFYIYIYNFEQSNSFPSHPFWCLYACCSLEPFDEQENVYRKEYLWTPETQIPGIISKCHSWVHSTTTHTWILFVVRKIFLSSPKDLHSVYCLGFPSWNKCPMPTIPEKVPKPSSGCQKSQNVTTGSTPSHQALVYDILPPTTDVVDYAIGLENLSANEQFFDDAQTAVSL